jgi:DNA-binding SARP family transcriptional activator
MSFSIFWPKAPRNRARQSARQALWLLRRTLGPDAIRRDDPVELARDFRQEPSHVAPHGSTRRILRTPS